MKEQLHELVERNKLARRMRVSEVMGDHHHDAEDPDDDFWNEENE